jgi:hypothetical protein
MIATNIGARLEVVTGYSPKDECERDDADSDKNRDPDRAADEQLAHIRLTDGECAEGRRLRLHEEDEERVQLVLVRDEEESGKGEREEELRELRSHQLQAMG